VPVRGLTIIVAAAHGDRLHAALTFACAAAARGAPTRLHLHGSAVAHLARPIDMVGDTGYSAHGLPTLGEIFNEAFGLGVAISACQSGLALAGLTADKIDSRIAMLGPVGILQMAVDDQTLTF
jgi:predicted peroxiredoxin